MRSRYVVLLALMGPLHSTGATANPTSLSFEAPDSCPGESELVAAVEARGAMLGDSGDSSGRELTVIVRQDGEAYVGTAHVRTPGEPSEPREVRGDTCPEVIDALAVVVAIALNPEAAPPDDASEPDDAAKTAESAGKGEPPRRGETRSGDGSVEVDAARLGYDPAFAITLYLGAALGPVPNEFIPRLDASFHLANFVSYPDGTRRLVGPVFRARLGLSTPPEPILDTADTRVEIGLQSIAVGACWAPHYDSGGLLLLACGELGATFMGFDIEDKMTGESRQETLGYGTIGPVLEAQYNLGPRFHMGAKVGVDFVVGKFSVRNGDGSKIFDSWSWSANAMLGAGVHF